MGSIGGPNFSNQSQQFGAGNVGPQRGPATNGHGNFGNAANGGMAMGMSMAISGNNNGNINGPMNMANMMNGPMNGTVQQQMNGINPNNMSSSGLNGMMGFQNSINKMAMQVSMSLPSDTFKLIDIHSFVPGPVRLSAHEQWTHEQRGHVLPGPARSLPEPGSAQLTKEAPTTTAAATTTTTTTAAATNSKSATTATAAKLRPVACLRTRPGETQLEDDVQ